MLTALGAGLRFRLAFALALFAAFCFVAPPAVLAMGHGKNTVHCLANADAVNHGKNKADRGEHEGHQPPAPEGKSASHTSHSAPGDHKMSCCGLFCLSAIEVDANQVADLVFERDFLLSLASSLLSRSPERLDRPPIPLLSL